MPPKSGSKRPRKLPTIRPSTSGSHASNGPSRMVSEAPVTQGSSSAQSSGSSSWITKIKNKQTRSTTQRLVFDNTLLRHDEDTSVPASPSQSQELANETESSSVNFINTGVQLDDAGDCPMNSFSEVKKGKRKRQSTAKSRLAQWIGLRDSTLDEILRHDGLGQLDINYVCFRCQGEVENPFRCRDCGHGTALQCRACLIQCHAELPLHRVETWNGKFFTKTSLSTLGLRVQLGHDGGMCPCPVPGPVNFTVFSTAGAHNVNINYCDCQRPPLERRIQLLRMQWFPATHVRPQTVFTFDCLDTFHESTLQGKGNLYDYYHMLLRKTDNANIEKAIYRFPEIHRVFRLWRNMMVWKRAGRGQDPSGIDGTPRGGLMVECPACPHPGRNLPDNWKNSGPLLFLYTLFIAVDANFKLKGKDRKLSDIDLAPGTGAFVEQNAYQAHIDNYKEQPEINTCRSEHDAIVRASIRSTPGYAVSGVGLVLCSRHSLVLKNGVGDLQKGERYCNMDFIVLSALMGVALLCVFITYDIACQWSKNLYKRMPEFPEEMRVPTTTKIQTAIPSWHINGHGPACRENFCLGYTKGVGRTCGEEVEVSWSHTNALAPSTREMAPAARREALNDHWTGWNFRKLVGFGPAMARKFREAAKLRRKHEASFKSLTSTFNKELIQQWTSYVEKWENDHTKPNPYKEPTNTVTLQDVRLELAKEEAASAAAGKMPPHKVTMSGFVVNGLDLEDQQYKLRAEIASKPKVKATRKKEADLHEKRTALLRRIHNWRQAQLVYTPHVATLIAESPSMDENGQPIHEAENIPLFLPSALPAHIRATEEMKRVCEMEISLRKAAADDALFDIRRGRRNITKLWKYKKINVSGTGNRPNTRMLTVYNRMYYKVERAAHKYRKARSALIILDPKGQWNENLRELRQEDIRGPGKDPNDTGGSNGRYDESWIWTVQRSAGVAADEEKEFNEDMRVEWTKSRARMMRWQEEYLLVQEEMRRVLVWYDWKAGWWEEQAMRRSSASSDILSGVRAYAFKQANIIRRMAERCAFDWLPVLEAEDIEPGWKAKYNTGPVEKEKSRAYGHNRGNDSPEVGEETVGDDDEGLHYESSDGEGDGDGDGEGDEEQEVIDDFEFDD